MYGTQDASHVWQQDYSNHLVKNRFKQGQAWTSVFRHDMMSWISKLLVHGDDFLVLEDKEGQEYMQKILKEKYEYRCDGEIGRNSGDHLTILNRIVTFEKETGKVTHEADPRHAEMIIRTAEFYRTQRAWLHQRKKKKASDVLASVGLPPVTAEQTTLYRSLVMRAQFLSARQSWSERNSEISYEKDESTKWKWHEGLEKAWKIFGRTTKSGECLPPAKVYQRDQSLRGQRSRRLSIDQKEHYRIHNIHWKTLCQTRIKFTVYNRPQQWRKRILRTH